MLSSELVFGSSGYFEIIYVQSIEDLMVVPEQCRTSHAARFNCLVNSRKLHSYYYRKVKGLPAFHYKVSHSD